MASIVMKIPERKTKNVKKQPLLSLLFLGLGGFGILLFLGSAGSLPWQIYPAAVLLCYSLWYGFFFRRALLGIFLGMASLSALILGIGHQQELRAQAGFVLEYLSNRAETTSMELGVLAWVLLMFFALVWSFAEARPAGHLLLYGLSMLVLLFFPLYGYRMSIWFAAILFVFQLAYWLLHNVQTQENTLQTRKQASLSVKSGLGTALFLCLLFLAVSWLVQINPQRFYDMVYQVEGSIYRIARQASGSTQTTETNGSLSRGNNHRTREVRLELEMQEKPEEMLYLYGFHGGEYQENAWTEADEHAMLWRVVQKLHWRRWYEMTLSMYDNMYFILNTSSASPDAQARSLRIQHTGETKTFYAPYYSQLNLQESEDIEETAYRRYSYTYRYYETQEVDIDWERAGDLGEASTWFADLQEVYQAEAQETYTQLPEERVPQLLQLVKDSPQEGLPEITAFILDTLHSRASYTLTPGWTPVNEDLVEYFLFKSGQGYCQHFAAAATLMYRAYGIPARYVTGYRVDPSAFQEESSGAWRAEVTEEAAHAWTEIFLEDYGWVPVEVTPASDGSITAAYPGFDSSELESLLQKWNTEAAVQSQERAKLALQAKQAPNTEAAEARDTEEKEATKTGHSLALCVLVLFLYTLCLLPLFLDYRRLRHMQSMQSKGCRYVFTRWIQLLHTAGYFLEENGSEEDFPKRAAKDLPILTEAEVARLQDIVNHAAFGPWESKAEEEAFVWFVYQKTSEFLRQQRKGVRRVLFYFIKQF